jgi:hypothetical protein
MERFILAHSFRVLVPGHMTPLHMAEEAYSLHGGAEARKDREGPWSQYPFKGTSLMALLPLDLTS